MFSTRYIPKQNVTSRNWREHFDQDTQSVKRLIVGNKQKCLVCKIVRIINGKFERLQDRSKAYIHANNCSQKDRF